MIKFRYPPAVRGDGSIEYDRAEDDWRYPTEPVGYERDVDNPWRFIPWWRPCQHRQMSMRQRPCGQALVRMHCTCEGCPLNGKRVSPEDCEFCEVGE